MGAGARWAVGGVVAGLALAVGALLVVVGIVTGAAGWWFSDVAFADDHEGVVTAVDGGQTAGGSDVVLVDVRWTVDGQELEDTGQWASSAPPPEVGDAVAVHTGPAVDRPTVRPPQGPVAGAEGTRNAGVGLLVAGGVLVAVAVAVLVLTAVWARRAPRAVPPGPPPFPPGGRLPG